MNLHSKWPNGFASATVALAFVLALAACAGVTATDAVRTRYSLEHSCMEDEVSVRPTEGGEADTYEAFGCGPHEVYHCVGRADGSGQVRCRGVDDSGIHDETRRRPPGPGPGPGPGSGSIAGPPGQPPAGPGVPPPPPAVRVSISASGQARLGEQVVGSNDALLAALTAVHAQGASIVVVAPDAGVRYARVVEVLDIARSAGFASVSVEDTAPAPQPAPGPAPPPTAPPTAPR